MYYLSLGTCKGLRITGESVMSDVSVSRFYILSIGSSSTNWGMIITHNDWSGLYDKGLSGGFDLISVPESPTSMGVNGQILAGFNRLGTLA
jgi:hypothetical protein